MSNETRDAQMDADWTLIWQQMLAFSPGSKADVRVFFAPGRVNLIGEHTDYNGGYVLPAALEQGTWVMVRPRQDGVLRFASTFSTSVIEIQANDITFDPDHSFANYPKGVLRVLQQLGCEIAGGDFFLHGNLPIGAGLSSSASVEVAVGTAVNAIYSTNLTAEKIALVSQQAENQFVGMNCGIMDQFAVAMGKRGYALSLNCASLEYQLVPLQTGAYQLVITNTNTPHNLVESKYNERRQECEDALRILQQVRPGLKHLADVTLEAWADIGHNITDPTLYRRARHIVTENYRARHAVELLSHGDLETFGRLMNESHISLRDDYEVTGFALDTLAEAAWSVEGCIGSRMTGGGFGGCTVSLVHKDAIDTFVAQVTHLYEAKLGREPSFYVTEIGDGAKEVTLEVMSI